jgi:hypothetical protein
MGTVYEVTYRNMFPSDALNARIRDNFGALKARFSEARTCSAWVERAVDDRLKLRIEVVEGARPLGARRVLAPQQDVCAEIDAAFLELRRGLESGGFARAA